MFLDLPGEESTGTRGSSPKEEVDQWRTGFAGKSPLAALLGMHDHVGSVPKRLPHVTVIAGGFAEEEVLHYNMVRGRETECPAEGEEGRCEEVGYAGEEG